MRIGRANAFFDFLTKPIEAERITVFYWDETISTLSGYTIGKYREYEGTKWWENDDMGAETTGLEVPSACYLVR